jgi:outer membrane protein assembly factor BamA
LNVRLTDSEHFIPAFFDNIVWFSDEELLKELHQRVPLFRGEVPTVGTLAQQVSDALQALLSEKRLPHHVAYSMLEFELPGSDARQAIQESPNVVSVSNEGGLPVHVRVAPQEVLQPDHVEVCDFHVTGPKIRMRAVNVRGAKEPQLTELRVVASDLHDREYSRRSLRTLAEHGLRPVYLKNGDLKVAFGDPQACLVRKASEENEVDVTFSISPGKQYRWAGLEWSGVSIFPIETLEPYIHLARGHPANVVEFELDLDRLVEELYYSRGYVASDVAALPQIDEQHSTVRYQVRVREGAVYHVGTVEVEGLDVRDAARIREKLKLHSGDVYDQGYFDNSSNLRHWSFGWKVDIELTRNDELKVVDIVLRFRR